MATPTSGKRPQHPIRGIINRPTEQSKDQFAKIREIGSAISKFNDAAKKIGGKTKKSADMLLKKSNHEKGTPLDQHIENVKAALKEQSSKLVSMLKKEGSQNTKDIKKYEAVKQLERDLHKLGIELSEVLVDHPKNTTTTSNGPSTTHQQVNVETVGIGEETVNNQVTFGTTLLRGPSSKPSAENDYAVVIGPAEEPYTSPSEIHRSHGNPFGTGSTNDPYPEDLEDDIYEFPPTL